MNPLQQLLKHKSGNLLSLFFTAGYPNIDSTESIIASAEKAGIDFLEVGMPYSDPLADGPVIQQSSSVAIANGMNIKLLFHQLEQIKGKYKIPLLMMGYLNPVLQYGTEKFLQQAKDCGVSGLILPDLPLQEYVEEYQVLFEKHELSFVFLVTPHTSEERIRLIDSHSNAFIYVVSTAATTGKQQDFGMAQQNFFNRIKSMNLKNPLITGFGIHNAQTLQQAWKNLNGAICGSAFLKKLEQNNNPDKAMEMLLKDLGLKDA
ncbi:MAG: tryptophan synthase subunit alpha [Bacteroidetes bacterium]|nr:MAG: tryptophan synthase subunit alpha [Bacteroidota bacterium]